MKQEEEDYLYDLKKKDGKSPHQISKELERDRLFEEKRLESKRRKKKKVKEQKVKDKEINIKFKEEFKKLR